MIWLFWMGVRCCQNENMESLSSAWPDGRGWGQCSKGCQLLERRISHCMFENGGRLNYFVFLRVAGVDNLTASSQSKDNVKEKRTGSLIAGRTDEQQLIHNWPSLCSYSQVFLLLATGLSPSPSHLTPSM